MISFDPGFGTNTLKMAGALRPDLHILSQSYHGNRLFVGLLGIEYRRSFPFGMPHRPTGPNIPT